MKELTHFSLFTGIGGIDRAAEKAGFQTVGQCEFADFPTAILEKHWPEVPRWRDIRDVTAESFYERTGLRTVDLISGGFPCQPFSVAGKQEGKKDDRYLWPEMLRVIRELKPRWVLGENVPGILPIAGDTVCEDLECEGYEVGVFDYEAAAVGASHRRERIFFVGYAKNGNAGLPCRAITPNAEFRVCCKDAPNADSEGSQISGYESQYEAFSSKNRIEHCNFKRISTDRGSTQSGLGGMADGIPAGLDGTIVFPLEPDIPRVAVGIKDRKDRLKCLGNAVVPQQVYPILQAIATMEQEAELI